MVPGLNDSNRKCPILLNWILDPNVNINWPLTLHTATIVIYFPQLIPPHLPLILFGMTNLPVPAQKSILLLS